MTREHPLTGHTCATEVILLAGAEEAAVRATEDDAVPGFVELLGAVPGTLTSAREVDAARLPAAPRAGCELVAKPLVVTVSAWGPEPFFDPM